MTFSIFSCTTTTETWEHFNFPQENLYLPQGFPGDASGKESTHQCRRHGRRGFDPWVWKSPLEEGMEIHSSILAWRTPWTEEHGGRWSMRSERGRHDWVSTHAGTHTHTMHTSSPSLPSPTTPKKSLIYFPSIDLPIMNFI